MRKRITWQAIAAYLGAKLLVMAVLLWLVSCGKEEKIVYVQAQPSGAGQSSNEPFAGFCASNEHYDPSSGRCVCTGATYTQQCPKR